MGPGTGMLGEGQAYTVTHPSSADSKDGIHVDMNQLKKGEVKYVYTAPTQ